MKNFKIICLFFLFVFTCISASAQTTTKNNPCDQKSAERAQFIKETEKNQYRVRRIEFWGNVFIRDKAFRKTMEFTEGDIFSKELLEKSIKNINKSFEIYSISLKNVWIRLDKSNKDVYLVFCVKEK